MPFSKNMTQTEIDELEASLLTVKDPEMVRKAYMKLRARLDLELSSEGKEQAQKSGIIPKQQRNETRIALDLKLMKAIEMSRDKVEEKKGNPFDFYTNANGEVIKRRIIPLKVTLKPAKDVEWDFLGSEADLDEDWVAVEKVVL